MPPGNGNRVVLIDCSAAMNLCIINGCTFRTTLCAQGLLNTGRTGRIGPDWKTRAHEFGKRSACPTTAAIR